MAVLLAAATTGFAGSLTYTLVGAGPTGEVDITSPEYGLSGNFYAGVLDWTTGTPTDPATANYLTYCIDIQSVISIGTQYSFTASSPESLSSAGLFSTTVDDAIDDLFYDESTAAELAPGSITSTTVSSLNGSSTENTLATEFQLALWDVIYSSEISDGKVTFSSPSPSKGYDDNTANSMLSDAQGWATTALDQANEGINNADAEALVSNDGGQNQAIYISMVGSPVSLPLPASIGSGIVLLGLAGTGAIWRRRAKISVA
ncbi:MAG TPA: hypothetical protein VMD30_06895 [Tepidisphaeraceae bacterium]|nr:hypothetical protein [Tepidisphaeraceae bacterium]